MEKTFFQRDYHVNVESQFYSVPYEYISNHVQNKLNKDLKEIELRVING
ncbi:Mu transposase domain-containing protein [Xylocopilactobacillus apis]